MNLEKNNNSSRITLKVSRTIIVIILLFGIAALYLGLRQKEGAVIGIIFFILASLYALFLYRNCIDLDGDNLSVNSGLRTKKVDVSKLVSGTTISGKGAAGLILKDDASWVTLNVAGTSMYNKNQIRTLMFRLKPFISQDKVNKTPEFNKLLDSLKIN